MPYGYRAGGGSMMAAYSGGYSSGYGMVQSGGYSAGGYSAGGYSAGYAVAPVAAVGVSVQVNVAVLAPSYYQSAGYFAQRDMHRQMWRSQMRWMQDSQYDAWIAWQHEMRSARFSQIEQRTRLMQILRSREAAEEDELEAMAERFMRFNQQVGGDEYGRVGAYSSSTTTSTTTVTRQLRQRIVQMIGQNPELSEEQRDRQRMIVETARSDETVRIYADWYGLTESSGQRSEAMADEAPTSSLREDLQRGFPALQAAYANRRTQQRLEYEDAEQPEFIPRARRQQIEDVVDVRSQRDEVSRMDRRQQPRGPEVFEQQSQQQMVVRSGSSTMSRRGYNEQQAFETQQQQSGFDESSEEIEEPKKEKKKKKTRDKSALADLPEEYDGDFLTSMATTTTTTTTTTQRHGRSGQRRNDSAAAMTQQMAALQIEPPKERKSKKEKERRKAVVEDDEQSSHQPGLAAEYYNNSRALPAISEKADKKKKKKHLELV